MNEGENEKKTKLADQETFSPFNMADPNEGASPSRTGEYALTNPAPTFTFDTDEEQNQMPKRRRRKKKTQPYLMILSLVVATLYVVGALLYINNLQPNGASGLDAFTMIVTLLGPAGLAVMAGFLGETIMQASRDSRAFTAYARRLAEPEKTLTNGIKSRLTSVREEIERLENTITNATNRLSGLEENIKSKNQELRDVTTEARGGADQLVSTMEAERNRLASILNGLSELNKTAQLSAKQASVGLDEKTAILSKAAEALTQTSSLAANAAERAAERLDGAVDKAFGAASNLDEVSTRGEQALGRAHDLMVLARVSADKAIGGVSNAIEYLNDAATNAAETAKQVSDLVSQENENTRQNSEALIENVRNMAQESAQHIVNIMQTEAQNASQKAQDSVIAFEATADSIKKLTEEAGKLIAAQLQANKHRIDNLRQQSFELNQEADSFAQNRMNSARDLIDQSSNLLNDAGEKINSRFNEVANVCIEQAKAIENIVDGLNKKLDEVPKHAQDRAKIVEGMLSETLTKLNDAGRQAAEEAKSLNDNFQGRLQESYSALGEVAQRLAAISGFGAQMGAPLMQPVAPINPAPKPPINDDAILPDPRPIINRAQSQAAASPVQAPSNQTPSPTVEKPAARPSNFGSILSPNTPVRSTKIETQKPDFDANSPKEASAPIAPVPITPAFVLRGRTSTNDDEIIASQKKQAAPQVLQEVKPPKAKEPPLKEVSLPLQTPSEPPATQAAQPIEAPKEEPPITRESPPTSITLNHDVDRDWSWREVLLSSGAQKLSIEDKSKADILREFALVRILNDVTLERYLQSYARNPAKAKDQTKSNLPMQINGLQRKIAENLELRPFLVRFVEERRELVKMGRLRGDDLRVYLLAEAALDI